MVEQEDAGRIRCPACQHEPPAQSHFCNRCGAALVDVPASGERRWLTVMFCDMVESTKLAQRLDAEDLQLVVSAYQEACARAVRNFDGHIAQYLGDGVLVYFGYPRAHEDDAIRAVESALEIHAAVPAINSSVSHRLRSRIDRPLAVRIVIHSGEVVLSDLGRGSDQHRLALGDTLNITARLQGIARPGETLISAATQRLVRGAFATVDLGNVRLKGVAEPVGAHRVVASSGARSRLERSARAGLTPLVGREQEIALILDRWEQTVEGRGQAVLISGDPGIGKSRLVAVVDERIAAESLTLFMCRCSVDYRNSAFHPIVRMLEQRLGIEDGDSEEQRSVKVESGLQAAELPSRHIRPLVGLLSVRAQRHVDAPPAQGENPRNELLDSLTACVLQLSGDRPLVLVVEDLHWIDPSTLELLGRLLARTSREHVLLLFTFRPSFAIPWDPGPQLVSIALSPLTRDQVAELCTAVAGGRTLPAPVLAELVAKADGVPLFAEELTRTVLESDLIEEHSGRLVLAGPLRDLSIPSTLQESLMSRLDGVGPAKELAQLCAVVGREVSHELVQAVSRLPGDVLQANLQRLIDAGLLTREGAPDQSRYIFRHALIHETAYDSLLRSERQELHARIARILEQRLRKQRAVPPEDLARHYERAGAVADAVRYYHLAAIQAAERAAHVEAIGHLEAAIGLIAQLPESADRDLQELDLQVALGTATMIAKGQGYAQVEVAHARARELSQKTENKTGLFRALWGLSRFYQSQGRPSECLEMADQLRELAVDDPSLLRWAHLARGQALFWRGDPKPALAELRETIRIGAESGTATDLHIFGQDPDLSSRALVGPALWILGQPATALAESRESCERGLKTADPFTHALVLCFGGIVHQLRGERARTRELAGAAIDLAVERAVPLFIGFGRVMKGWAMTEDAGDDAGVDEIKRGLVELRGAGAGVGGPFVLALLVDALRTVRQPRDALAFADTALDLAANQQSHFWDSELFRLKGELVRDIDSNAFEDSEQLLRRAIDLAKDRHAQSLELRAVISLARLLADRGDRDAGVALVREVYDRFDEGFDTRDLLEAGALLGEGA
jgi:class 3 adenylate cyclase/tetratricopeptide (TPR) repeat protein